MVKYLAQKATHLLSAHEPFLFLASTAHSAFLPYQRFFSHQPSSAASSSRYGPTNAL